MKLKSSLGSLGLALALGSAALTTHLHQTWATGGDEASIAKVTARLLENSAYASHRETGQVSGRFLVHYLDVLDRNRLYFLQSDLEEFAPYRTNLEAMVVKKGDTRPAHQIFNRLLQRLEQRVAYNKELLEPETFDFTGDDNYRWDRHDDSHLKTYDCFIFDSFRLLACVPHTH